jgi:hypothetical protein
VLCLAQHNLIYLATLRTLQLIPVCLKYPLCLQPFSVGYLTMIWTYSVEQWLYNDADRIETIYVA